MSSEQVSDMRLDELLVDYHGDFANFNPQARDRHIAVYSALSELKSRRAQQAEPPAGCAEMATTIEKAIADADESGFDEGRCGIIQKAIAPLFVIPQGCAELARELSDLADDHVFCDQDGSAWVRSEYRKAVAAKLAPLFTLLAECRTGIDRLVGVVRRHAACDVGKSEVRPNSTWEDTLGQQLIHKLDAALGKGDADGGREEESSE